MMGWKGTMRSMAAASRAAARDAERRRKAINKQNALDDAYDAVVDWEDYIARLITVHVDLADAIDWHSVVASSKPTQPKHQTTHHDRAQKKLSTFKAGLFDKLFGRVEKKLSSLEDDLASAKEKDKAEFQLEKEAHKSKLDEWKSETQFAKRLINGDVEAIRDVLKELEGLVNEDRIGDQISFAISQDVIHAMPSVHTDEIVPKTRRKLRASGSLSETKMPVGEFNELYQDYVCSVALKVAGDLFHVLPHDTVFVTCMVTMLNTTSGHMEPTAVLSVQFVRETFKSLNLEGIDPSDSMDNFNHVMKFRRTKGFAAVEPLVPVEAET